MRHLHRWLSLLVPLLLLTMIGVALVPLATVSPSAQRGEGDFYAYVTPRLVALVDAVERVESLVANRSRNIIALQANADRIETQIEEIDRYLLSSDYRGDHATVVNHYRHGSDSIIVAIEQARTAMRTFDFAAIPNLIPMFTSGSKELSAALSLLQSTGKGRSSYTEG